MARTNKSDLRELGERLVKQCYNSEKTPVTIKRLRVREITKRYSTYEDIVKKSQELFNVFIYRDPNCIELGIYIIGRESYAEACKKFIDRVIRAIEKDTWYYGNPYKSKQKLHGNKAYARYASNRARSMVYVLLDLIVYKERVLDVKKISQSIADFVVLKHFVKNNPTLNNKTKYHDKIRYLGGANENIKASV